MKEVYARDRTVFNLDRSQGFFPKKMGRAGKSPTFGRSHDPKRHPEVVGVINEHELMY